MKRRLVRLVTQPDRGLALAVGVGLLWPAWYAWRLGGVVGVALTVVLGAVAGGLCYLSVRVHEEPTDQPPVGKAW